MLRQISLAWRNVKNNRRTIGLSSLDNWRGVNLWRNKNELSTLGSDGLIWPHHHSFERGDEYGSVRAIL